MFYLPLVDLNFIYIYRKKERKIKTVHNNMGIFIKENII